MKRDEIILVISNVNVPPYSKFEMSHSLSSMASSMGDP